MSEALTFDLPSLAAITQECAEFALAREPSG